MTLKLRNIVQHRITFNTLEEIIAETYSK